MMPDSLTLLLMVGCGFAAMLSMRASPAYTEENCSCAAGTCPAWEAKAGLKNPDPDCPIHGDTE